MRCVTLTRSTARRARRRLRLVCGASACAVMALVLAAPVAGFTASGTPADCAAADAGVRVRLVIDFGILAAQQGAPASTASQCTTVTAGANGFKVLEAGGHTYRVNSSDLLCAIDGYPRGNECGDRTAEGYRYWAYFSGGSQWTYSGIGPGFRSVSEGSVEGWHFVSGKGNPTDPPPSAAPQACAPSPTTPPPTAAPTTAPPGPAPTTRSVPPTGGGTSGGNVPAGPGSAASSSTVAPAARPTQPGPDNGLGPSAAPGVTTGAGAPAPDGAPSGTEPGAVPAAPAGTEVVPAEGAGAAGSSPTAGDPASGDVDVAASPTASRSQPASAPVGAILAGIAVLALGGFAVVRMRARPEEP